MNLDYQQASRVEKGSFLRDTILCVIALLVAPHLECKEGAINTTRQDLQYSISSPDAFISQPEAQPKDAPVPMGMPTPEEVVPYFGGSIIR